MGLGALFIVAIGLSMDAFAVSICKGLSVCRVRPRHAIITGLWFGGFQALMPLVGYLLAGFVQNVWVVLGVSLVLMIAVLWLLTFLANRKKD